MILKIKLMQHYARNVGEHSVSVREEYAQEMFQFLRTQIDEFVAEKERQRNEQKPENS